MANSSETVPESKVTGRWADEADTEAQSSVAEAELDLLTLEEARKAKQEISDPDDSRIEPVSTGDAIYASAKKFEDLNLYPELLKGLYVEMKFEKPSKIQAVSFPMILTPPFKNLVAQAHNGSCLRHFVSVPPVNWQFRMRKFTEIKSELAIPASSTNYTPVRKRAVITAQVVIGTPGTISNLITLKKLSMAFMKILVFDEADHILAEGGFRDDSRKIMKTIVQSSPDCQVILFSATFSDVVRAFVDQTIKDIFNNDYNQMFVKKEELSLASVKQYKVNCPDELVKVKVVRDKILELGDRVGQTIIFVRTRKSAIDLHNNLIALGYEVTTIQGAQKQEERDLIIKEFREGLTAVLISTDVLAQGFDQAQVNLVINYDLPVDFNNQSEPDYEVYLHRVGRAGRFGCKGAVFNLLCTDNDLRLMQKIEKYFNCEIDEVPKRNEDKDFLDTLKKAGLV